MSPVARRFADGWVCIVKRMLAKLSSSSLQYWIMWGIEVVGGSSVAAICVCVVCVCVCVCVCACVCVCVHVRGVGVCATCVCVWLCLFGVYRHKNKEELGLQGYVYICVWYVHVCIYVCKCACMYEERLKEEARIGKCSNEWCQLQWYTHFWVSTSASQLKKCSPYDHQTFCQPIHVIVRYKLTTKPTAWGGIKDEFIQLNAATNVLH